MCPRVHRDEMKLRILLYNTCCIYATTKLFFSWQGFLAEFCHNYLLDLSHYLPYNMGEIKWQENITRLEFIPRRKEFSFIKRNWKVLWWVLKHSKTGSTSPGKEKSYPTTVDISLILQSRGSRQRMIGCVWTSFEGRSWTPTMTTTSPSFKRNTVCWIMNT